jgi:hypothetical protein
MNIQGSAPIQAPIAPPPAEQVGEAKKAIKPAADEGASAAQPAPAAVAASKPSDPDGAGKIHKIA